LATPTSDAKRLKTILDGAGGFLYYVSITGVTGTKSFAEAEVRAAVAGLQGATKLPCAVGFGIKTPEQAAGVARFADAAVVGSAIVERMAAGAAVDEVAAYCASLAEAVHGARQ